MAIAARPDDWIGFQGLVQTWRGPQPSTEYQYHNLENGETFQYRCGFMHHGTGICNITGYGFNRYGVRIRGSADATNPNTFEIGRDDTETGTVRWALGFDPDGVRMEIFFQATRTGAGAEVDIPAPVINGSTLVGGLKEGDRNSFRIAKFLNQGNADPYGLGELYHIQFEYSGTPSSSLPAESKWFLDEGPLSTPADEEATRTLSWLGTEDTDYQWVDKTPSASYAPIYKQMQNLGVY